MKLIIDIDEKEYIEICEEPCTKLGLAIANGTPLEAQPTDADCISREAMLSLHTEYAEKMGATTFWKLRDDILKLPSVTPQPSEDCISRQAVLDYAKDTCLDLDKYEDTDVFCDEIKAMPSVTPQQTRWIPVSERLPEPNVAVLTYINTGATETYCLAYWNNMCEAWEEWIGIDLIEKDKGYKVIAWRELPEPY